MKRAGNPDKAVMEISGHKTRSVFDRYDIIRDEDITSVPQRTEEYLKARKKASKTPVSEIGPMISPIALGFRKALIAVNSMMLRWLCPFTLEWRNWQTHGTQKRTSNTFQQRMALETLCTGWALDKPKHPICHAITGSGGNGERVSQFWRYSSRPAFRFIIH
jgi:hypothetical protein